MNLSMINNICLYRFRLELIKLIFVMCDWVLFCTNIYLFIYLFVYYLFANGKRWFSIV